jgi:hypothetical protein
MLEAEFAQALYEKFLSVDGRDTYRSLLRDEELTAFMRADLPPEFQVMADLYSELNESQRQKFFISLDLAIADTISNLLSVIDGSGHLPHFEGGLDVEYDGTKISGGLTTTFLDLINSQKPIP